MVNIVATLLAVGSWGYFVYQGVVDPLGGINSLWPLFGVGNQLLAAMALVLATVVLVKMKKQQYIWVTVIPTVFLTVTCLYAGYQKIFHENPAIGFLAQANKYSAAIAKNELIAPAKSIDAMQGIVTANQINAVLCGFFMIVLVVMIGAAIGVIMRALKSSTPTVVESEAVYADPVPLTANAGH